MRLPAGDIDPASITRPLVGVTRPMTLRKVVLLPILLRLSN